MYCYNCGRLIADSDAVCPRCGWTGVAEARLKAANERGLGVDDLPVPNYLAQAILLTIFCCLPFGVVAIAYAAQVDGKELVGDLKGAVLASKSARTWCWIAFWCGIAVILGAIAFHVMRTQFL